MFKISMKVERVGGDFLHGSNEHIKTFLNKLSDALHPKFFGGSNISNHGLKLLKNECHKVISCDLELLSDIRHYSSIVVTIIVTGHGRSGEGGTE